MQLQPSEYIQMESTHNYRLKHSKMPASQVQEGNQESTKEESLSNQNGE